MVPVPYSTAISRTHCMQLDYSVMVENNGSFFIDQHTELKVRTLQSGRIGTVFFEVVIFKHLLK